MGSKVKPTTPADKVLSRKHIQQTTALLKKKIADHAAAEKKAMKAGDKASARYNKAHKEGHIQELKKARYPLSK